MQIQSGNASFSADEVENFRNRGFDVNLHTRYYANGITVSLPDGTTIGFHNWIDNADCYAGDEQITLKSDAHLNAVLAAMDSIVAMNKFSK